ncbi:MAG: hypothetical protein ABL963_01005 [Longimicrobiales bacterium]
MATEATEGSLGGGGVSSTSPQRATAPLFGIGTEHLGLVLTLGYLGVTSVGMVSAWALYARFDVNIFHFAQIGDFLLAATAWPLASLSAVLAIAAVAVVARIDRYSDRYRWYRMLYLDSDRVRRVMRSRSAWVLYTVLYLWLAADLHADWYEGRLRSGSGSAVTVQLQSGTYHGRDASAPFAATFVGATTAYVFLYDRPTGEVTVVPVENVASLVPVATE